MVAEPAGVDRRRHEVVAERVHRQQRRHARGVAEVVVERAFGERRARRRLHRDEAHVGVGHERQRDATEVRSAAAAADHDVGALLARERELLLRLEADDGLVQQHVVQHRAERVVRVVAGRGVAHGVADRETGQVAASTVRRGFTMPIRPRTPPIATSAVVIPIATWNALTDASCEPAATSAPTRGGTSVTTTRASGCFSASLIALSTSGMRALAPSSSQRRAERRRHQGANKVEGDQARRSRNRVVHARGDPGVVLVGIGQHVSR